MPNKNSFKEKNWQYKIDVHSQLHTHFSTIKKAIESQEKKKKNSIRQRSKAFNGKFNIPSQNSCFDYCSLEAPSQTGVQEISVFTLSSLPSQCPIKPIISHVKLISTMELFSKVMESVAPNANFMIIKQVSMMRRDIKKSFLNSLVECL